MGKGKKRGGGGGKNKQKKGAGSGFATRKDSPTVVRKKAASSSFPISGLMNLGNTCFFNSVMQSIGQTEHLRSCLNSIMDSQQQRVTLRVEQQQLEVEVSDTPGQLTKTLHAFMKDIATPPGRTLNPRPLFSQICDKAPRFRGYQQQDSQELLRYLLDCLKTEEAQRIKKGILTAFKVSSGKKSALSHLSQRDRDTIKMFGGVVFGQPTYVDQVFGGVFISSITCSECHNCSAVHENYLDLSLPVPRDEGTRGEGKHWFKGCKRENGRRDSAMADTQEEGGVKGGEEVREMETSKEPSTISKYQMKKARKKTRKGKGKQSSWQELQHLLSEAAEDKREEVSGSAEKDGGSVSATGEKETEGEGGVGREGPGENGKENTEAADIESEMPAPVATEDEQEERDEVGGDCGEATPTTPTASEPAPAETVDDDTTPDEVIEPNERIKPLHTEEDAPVESTGAVETSDVPSPRQPEEDTPPNEDTPTLNREENEATPTKNRPLTSAEFKEGSLEGCLRRFCSVEVLSGVNRFYCSVCSRRRSDEKSAARARAVRQRETNCENSERDLAEKEEEREGGSGARRAIEPELAPSEVRESHKEREGNCERDLGEEEEEGDSVSIEPEPAQRELPAVVESHKPEEEEDCAAKMGEREPRALEADPPGDGRGVDDPSSGEQTGGVEKLVEKTAAMQLAEEEGRGDEAEEDDDKRADDFGSRSNLGSASQCESGEESDYEGDNSLVTPTEVTLEKKERESPNSPSEEEDLVFRDATKQLLIKSLPPVLTLHLKRFFQDGRRLRKNGCHVNFPDLLDMAPFCLPDCQVPCDDQGQILYSLYAVVEHAGGMQGGHYTAYVRVRNSHAHFTNVGQEKEGVASPVTGLATVAVSTTNATTTTDDQRSISTTMVQNSTTRDHSSAERDQIAQPPNHHQTNCDQNGTTRDQTYTTEATSKQFDTTVDQTGTTNGAKPQPNNPSNQKFDLSSTGGQWYHISDTHIRTSTGTEVHKSQAYLLFYEQLTFQIS